MEAKFFRRANRHVALYESEGKKKAMTIHTESDTNEASIVIQEQLDKLLEMQMLDYTPSDEDTFLAAYQKTEESFLFCLLDIKDLNSPQALKDFITVRNIRKL